MATITATINYETRLCGSSIVAGCTPGQFFFAEEAGSCGACKKCQCDFFSLTDNPTCPTGLGPFLMVVGTGCLSRNYLSIPDFIDILDVEDKLVAIDASNTARYLFEQLEGCKNSAGADLLSISKSGAAPSQKIKFCINPANFEIKLTDLKDGPGSYADCTEFDWVYHSNQCSACSDDKCFKGVLTSGCGGNGWNRTCPVALFHAQIWTEQGYQEFELPHETEGGIMNIVTEKDGYSQEGDSNPQRYGDSDGSKTIIIDKRKRYTVSADVQGYNNKFVNSRRVGVLNITNGKEYADMKVGGRLNPSAGILPADRCSEPGQNVDVYPNSQYLHQMFHSLSYSQDIILDPGEYKLVLKIDTRTDGSGSQIGKVRITGRNGDTVLNESDGSVFTGLSIKEIVPAYYPIV